MQVDTVIENNRLWIGCGDKDIETPKIIGSVRKYDNCLAKLITKLFCKSIDLQIAGRTYCVNVNSFYKHLTNLGVSVKKNELKNFKYDDFIKKQDDQFRKNHLTNARDLASLKSDSARTKITQEMLNALFNGDLVKVKYEAWNGAYLNFPFFHSVKVGVSQHEDSQKAALDPKNPKEEYSKHVPFTWAVERGHKDIARYFLAIHNRDCTKAKLDIWGFDHANTFQDNLGNTHIGSFKVKNTRQVVVSDPTPGKEEFTLV